MKTTDWILLVVLSLVWGGSFFFNEIGLRELPVLSIVALRVAIAAVILWAVVLVRGHRIPSGFRHWSWFLTMGLVNNVLPFTLIVYGQTSVTAGLASILNATTPFFMVLIIVSTMSMLCFFVSPLLDDTESIRSDLVSAMSSSCLEVVPD